ncbi:MAG TPA: hypothetical protein VHE32_06090 [Rhodanobacteraceae bacterium]|nr:hypothetical protein [Rhodanobacteraceae bacterium]
MSDLQRLLQRLDEAGINSCSSTVMPLNSAFRPLWSSHRQIARTAAVAAMASMIVIEMKCFEDRGLRCLLIQAMDWLKHEAIAFQPLGDARRRGLQE